jgi:hypothetical protein
VVDGAVAIVIVGCRGFFFLALLLLERPEEGTGAVGGGEGGKAGEIAGGLMDAGLIVTTEVGIDGLGAMASALGGALVTVIGTGGTLRSVAAATSVIVGA